ncbi:MAG: isoleucine--tRNA ligase [Alphaproteobacteria bacterium]|nr:isoleucine--tRNA ligase [Alphaproteobacteria bacterium]
MTADYKSTLFLPRTEFPMKAGLPKREPALLERWERIGLWPRLREAGEGREKFILHDGPPYANGPIHIGTGMNKILKDMVNRSRQMMGRDAHFIPGWDCHGLPIEWQIEQEWRKQGKDKDQVPVEEFRRECRAYADRWIGVQMADFKRLGVLGAWDRPYLTMSYVAEAQIVREIGRFLINGGLYKGAKPVMWSPVEKTALAEAEVEYKDVTTPAIFVRFPVIAPSDRALDGASVVIWTTTPWTIPGNRAIAFGDSIGYGVYEVAAVADGSLARPGERLVLADALAEAVRKKAGIADWRKIASLTGTALAGTLTRHPLAGAHYRIEPKLYHGDFVATDQGSGFVHIAPGHGADDFELGARHGLEVPDTVGDDGRFLADVPEFAGAHVYKVNPAVNAALEEAGTLLAVEQYTHSYPHSWRSKKPVIFRNTPQWFISMDTGDLRATALRAIDATRWVPEAGRNRIRAMVEDRPDWCVSRQRAWGVPIAVFTDKETGEPLRDQAVIDRVAAAVEAAGADIWFTADPATFLGPDYDPARYEPVRDILDVWFDSGSTHSFVLEGDTSQQWPATVYLEGSDQHRGWFQSSLLEACGTRGRAPYEVVLTHGFVMDGEGRKMSKSLGNTIEPQEVIAQSGADILRLWVAMSDCGEDLRIGPEIIKGMAESYRRLRNTLRYLLGNLAGFDSAERLDPAEMPELERWVLHRLAELDAHHRRALDDYTFHGFYNALHNFCAIDLSAFYFDVRKDSLYCDSRDAPRRRAARTVLDHLFDRLTAWLAPVLAFTAEEAWLARWPSDDDSVHLRLFPETPAGWRDEALATRWERLRAIRRVITGALEVERRGKRIGASLQAQIQVFVSEADAALLDSVDLAELAITSAASVTVGAPPATAFGLAEEPAIGVVVTPAAGQKCARCWQVLAEVGAQASGGELCRRCRIAVGPDTTVAIARGRP